MYFQNREHMKKYMVEMTNVLEIKNTFDFSIIKRSKMNDIRKWFIENNKWEPLEQWEPHAIWELIEDLASEFIKISN